MSESTVTDDIAPFRDRKSRLVILGFLQIGFGVLSALVCLGMVFAFSVFTTVPDEYPFIVAIVGLTAAISTWFITMGVGSIKARRWSRALILATSWIGLARGVSTFSNALLDLFRRYGETGPMADVPPLTAGVMILASILFSALLHLGLPAFLILAYRGKGVQSTCERWNPEPCWTDSRPISVLALCFALCISPIEDLAVGFYSWVFPFFGVIVTGLPGLVSCLALACAYLYLAWATWNLRPYAWALSIIVCALHGLSSAITYSTVDTAVLYAAMNLPEEIVGRALETAESIPMKVATVISYAYSTAWIAGLILYTRRYYHPVAQIEIAP